MNIGFSEIASNIGVSFETTILLFVLFGSIIFFAKDFKLGILMLFLISGGVFMWFYAAGLNWQNAAIVFFMSLIVMSFTFYAVAKSSGTPGGGTI